MKAVLIDHSVAGKLRIGDVDTPPQQRNETLVAVRAFSLNRGDLKRTDVGPDGQQAGWDFSGIVEAAAPAGSGPPNGARVVGLSRRREGFAEYVSAPTSDVAEIPDGVSFTDAAALPVAGLTALYSLERCHRLLGSNVLITGASGGVGVLACQLAVQMGAIVYGQIRSPEHESLVTSTGATPLVTADGAGVAEHGPFRGIIDGVGGSLLANVLPSLSEDGRAILYGFTDETSATINIADLVFTGTGHIEGLYLFMESQTESCSKGLTRLSQLVDTGRLDCHISATRDWAHVASMAHDLQERRFPGKAVLTI